MFLMLLAGALLAQRGLEGLRQTWLSLETRLFQGVGQARFDQIRGATALGAVGRLKQSGRIVLRIRTDDGVAPGLLREAAFNRFRANIWGTSHREFQSVGLPLEGHVWRLAAAPGQGPLITIARYTSRGEAPLALPGDALSIRDLPALDVETNYLAAARMQEGPPLAIYTVEHGAGGGFDGPPEPEDTDLDSMNGPDAEAIARTARELGLAGRTPEAAVAAVAHALEEILHAHVRCTTGPSRCSRSMAFCPYTTLPPVEMTARRTPSMETRVSSASRNFARPMPSSA